MRARIDHRLLRRARELKELSKTEAAERLGVSTSSYARWERGVTQPQPQHLMPIARFCGCEIEDLAPPDDPTT